MIVENNINTNKTHSHCINLKGKINLLIITIALLMACFFPTSINGIIFDTDHIMGYYFLSCFIIGTFFFINKKDIRLIAISIGLLVFLEVVTLHSTKITGAVFSIARFAPVVICIILYSIRLDNEINFKSTGFILELVTIIIIIFNLGIMLKIKFVTDFIVKNYSQFIFYTVDNMVNNLGKPVFTFGAHTFASYYYIFIFYMWYITVKDAKRVNFRYYLYLIFLLFFTIMLKSSAALMFSVVMLLLILNLSKNTAVKIGIALSIIVIITIIFNTELYNAYYSMVTSSDNGVIPRYLANNNIFADNFRVLRDTIVGIGYTIPRNYSITYTDSGYIVYFTMGNIVLPTALFYLLYKFLKNNVNKYATVIFIFMLMFELAIPAIIYLKTTFFLIFTIAYIKSLESKKI